MKIEPVDTWVLKPVGRFINNSTTSGIVLFTSAAVAMIVSNSPWAEAYHHLWEHEFYFGFDDFGVRKSLHHWINDGLMAVFFFVVGLELKREIVAGELSDPKNAILPLAAGIGGMLAPALVYYFFNPDQPLQDGWGIPMATDIAFALGILYMLGNKVPVALKVFLTALAITDDVGAVLVIAFFYTSDISMVSLATGAGFMAVLITANLIGVRNTLFYGVVGIAGLWLAFLMSGVHATIAAVLAAFTIPVSVKMKEKGFIDRAYKLLDDFKHARPNNQPTVTEEQLHILEKFRRASKRAITPLQRLEHGLHPFVAFIVMPVFALANAGITISADLSDLVTNTVVLGVALGLLLGKFVGVVGTVYLLNKFNLADLPAGLNMRHIIGAGLLAGVGFTMSLFISELAFNDKELILQAKVGILAASLIAGFAGYLVLAAKPKSSLP
ncbi:MAG: Na+/H+ antiporter NhaA [Salibacteraceae bacterium]